MQVTNGNALTSSVNTTSKFIIFLVFLISIGKTFSQIPNNGFENWTNNGNYFSPDGWWTPNDSAGTGYYPVTRSSDHYPNAIGNYSLRMENNISILPDWGAMGIAWTGGWEGNNAPAFPITNHPVSLWGYFKFIPQNNDTMEIHLRLYKNGVDIGGGQFKSADTTSTWTSFTIQFTNYTDADSARIMILSCYDNDGPLPHGNSVLYIDNLSFDSLITDGISAVENQNPISTYPDPASTDLIINVGKYVHQTKLNVFDAFGNIVRSTKTHPIEGLLTLDVSDLREGIYFIQIISDHLDGYSSKVIIER